MSKQYIGSEEHWEDSINSDIERDIQYEEEARRQQERDEMIARERDAHESISYSKRQTGIDWLLDRLRDLGGSTVIGVAEERGYIEEARRIDKERMIAFGNDCVEHFHTDWKGVESVGDELFKQQYENDNNTSTPAE